MLLPNPESRETAKPEATRIASRLTSSRGFVALQVARHSLIEFDDGHLEHVAVFA